MDGNIREYLMTLKIAGIDPQTGAEICSCLEKQTLDRLLAKGMDRRIIKPILLEASKMKNGINDDNVNKVLDTTNMITSLMAIYCRE